MSYDQERVDVEDYLGPDAKQQQQQQHHQKQQHFLEFRESVRPKSLHISPTGSLIENEASTASNTPANDESHFSEEDQGEAKKKGRSKSMDSLEIMELRKLSFVSVGSTPELPRQLPHQLQSEALSDSGVQKVNENSYRRPHVHGHFLRTDIAGGACGGEGGGGVSGSSISEACGGGKGGKGGGGEPNAEVNKGEESRPGNAKGGGPVGRAACRISDVTGFIRMYNPNKGWGFITTPSHDGDIFLHAKHVLGPLPRYYVGHFNEGDSPTGGFVVKFDLDLYNTKRPQALNVRILSSSLQKDVPGGIGGIGGGVEGGAGACMSPGDAHMYGIASGDGHFGPSGAPGGGVNGGMGHAHAHHHHHLIPPPSGPHAHHAGIGVGMGPPSGGPGVPSHYAMDMSHVRGHAHAHMQHQHYGPGIPPSAAGPQGFHDSKAFAYSAGALGGSMAAAGGAPAAPTPSGEWDNRVHPNWYYPKPPPGGCSGSSSVGAGVAGVGAGAGASACMDYPCAVSVRDLKWGCNGCSTETHASAAHHTHPRHPTEAGPHAGGIAHHHAMSSSLSHPEGRAAGAAVHNDSYAVHGPPHNHHHHHHGIISHHQPHHGTHTPADVAAAAGAGGGYNQNGAASHFNNLYCANAGGLGSPPQQPHCAGIPPAPTYSADQYPLPYSTGVSSPCTPPPSGIPYAGIPSHHHAHTSSPLPVAYAHSHHAAGGAGGGGLMGEAHHTVHHIPHLGLQAPVPGCACVGCSQLARHHHHRGLVVGGLSAAAAAYNTGEFLNEHPYMDYHAAHGPSMNPSAASQGVSSVSYHHHTMHHYVPDSPEEFTQPYPAYPY